MSKVSLVRLEDSDRNQFVLDNQEAFKYGAIEEFGLRDEHYEEDFEIISRKTIEDSIDGGIAYRLVCDGKKVGGLVISLDGEHGELELLFVKPQEHTKGIGYDAWCEIERLYPDVKVWETITPYFEKRNIHFYVNKCGFHIVEYYNSHHIDPNDPDGYEANDESDDMGMFRFEKVIKK